LSLRGSVSTFLGTRDYALLTAGADAILSKKIGIAGLFKVAPYVGYSFLYVHGSSNVVLTFCDDRDPKTNGPCTELPEQQVFDAANEFKNFFIVGFQIVGAVANGGFEAAVTSGFQTYSLRIGVEF